MARGKHAKAAANKRAKELAERRVVLLGEIQQERDLLNTAIEQAAEVDSMDARLQVIQASTRRTLESELSRLRDERSTLTEILRIVRDQRSSVEDKWQRLSGQCIDRLGGGTEAIETFTRMLLGYDIQLSMDTGRNLGQVAMQRIERARGRRSRIEDKSEAPITGRFRHLLHPTRLEKLPPVGSLPSEWTEEQTAAMKGLREVLDCHPQDVSVESIYAWRTAHWINQPQKLDESILLRSLGYSPHPADAADKPIPATSNAQPHPIEINESLTATDRATVAASDPIEFVRSLSSRLRQSYADTRRRLPGPFSDSSRFPRPSDAVAIRHWYGIAAIGAWLTCGPDVAAAWGSISAGIHAAAPYWVPPGQIAGYLESEPLSDEDRIDLRLPYAQVLLVMSDPLHLPAVREPTECNDLDQVLDRLDRAMLARAARHSDITEETVREYVSLVENDGDRMALGDVLDRRGAVVEAVLLTGDALGNPTDSFAWCLAIPARYGGGVLARVMIPARLSETQYGDQVIDMIALTAWADWHAPEDRTADLGRGLSKDGQAKAGGSPKRSAGVHVLRVKRATNRQGEADAIGRSVSPHVRRGHWRRQRYGPLRSAIKRVRIAPVLVNAGRGGLAPRVYRLPSASERLGGRG